MGWHRIGASVVLAALVGCGDGSGGDGGVDTMDAATPRDAGGDMDATPGGEDAGDACAPGAPTCGDAGRPDAGSPDAGPTDWPTFGGVTAGSAPVHTDMAAPGYLEWTIDPRTTAPNVTDGRVPTEVARVTDAAAFGLPSDTTFMVQYSKVSPWNADGSLAVVFYAAGGPTRAALLDGRTFAFVRLLDDVWPVGRWSNTDPDVWIQPVSDAVPRFERVQISTGAVTVYRDFATDGYVDRTNRGFFGAEGNQSNDDRVWVFNLQRSDGAWELVIWDSVADVIRGRIPVPSELGSGAVVDWWTASQRGDFVVTQSHSPWTSGGTTIPRGNNVWSLAGEYLRTNDVSLGHLDTCIDGAGHDVLAYMGSKYGSNDKVAQTWRLDGADGTSSRDQMPDGFMGWAYHMNCRNTLRPGFVTLTSSLSRPPSDYNVFPMWNHVFALRLDGSGEPGIIANTHHSEGGESLREYIRSPFSPVNRDLSAVMFHADWDRATSGPIHLYVARPRR